MKLAKNTLILNKKDVNNMINRLDAVSLDILEMQDGTVNNEPKEFKNAFINATDEATRILNIKKALLKAGKNL